MPRKLRSTFIKAEDQAADAAAEDAGLDDMEQIPGGRQTRRTLELRRLKQASRLADTEEAGDEVADAEDDDDDDPDAQVCDPPYIFPIPHLKSGTEVCHGPAEVLSLPCRSQWETSKTDNTFDMNLLTHRPI